MAEQAFGVLSLLYALIPVLSTALSLGIEVTLKRYQPEYLRAGKLGAAHWLVRISALLRLGSNIVVLGLILLLWQWVAPIFQLTDYKPQFVLFCALILLHFQSSLLQLSLSSHMLQQYAVGMTALLAITKLTAYLAFAYLGNLTLTHAIEADIVAYMLMYVGTRIAHARTCLPPVAERTLKPSATERQRLLKFGLYNNFNDVGSMILTSKSDNFFIAAFLSVAATGAYSFYSRLVEMSSQLLPIRQFGNVVQPLFFAVPQEEAAEKIPRFVTFLLNTTFAIQLPILAFMTVYHAEIIGLIFGGKFLEYSWLLPLIGFFGAINRISEPVTIVAQYEEKASLLLLSKVFVIYNVVSMIALLPIAGLYGAAISTGTAQAMKNLFIWWKVRDLARWLNFKQMLLTSVIVWGAAIALCELARIFVPFTTIAQLLVGALVCGIAGLVYLRTPAIAESDRKILESVFKGKERRILQRIGLVRAHTAMGTP